MGGWFKTVCLPNGCQGDVQLEQIVIDHMEEACAGVFVSASWESFNQQMVLLIYP